MQVPLLDLTQQYRTIKAEVRQAIDVVCDEQSLILGKHVERFETHLARYCHWMGCLVDPNDQHRVRGWGTVDRVSRTRCGFFAHNSRLLARILR